MSLKSPIDRVPPTVQQGWQRLIWPLWNRTEGRLRAPLRALVPLVVSFLGLAAAISTTRARFDHPIKEPIELLGLVAVLAGSILISSKLLDRRPLANYGLAVDRDWLRSFAVGGLIATAVNAGTFLVALSVGWITVVDVAGGADQLPFLVAMAVTFALTAVAASWEEFVFRGAMLKNLAEGADGHVPRWVAVGLALAISTGVFAFMHSGKVTGPGGYGYYLLAGLIFGGIYTLTGDLGLPMGFHACYNFSMSAIFGLGVSQRSPELFVLDAGGPTVWIGEEGLLRVIFAAVGGLLLVVYIRWRDGTLGIDDRIPQWTPVDNPGS
ncbi:CPBP family intramembrane glutamic endopeptidase [Halohasta salina]|uniref:CPBP family intramembrane glutamic endopeptidase n=1 Tax=Halohasta salina TaxID=2961621 RepID=UPI0020A393D5|nr:CPBP family intramembrane glutamic endopeptidase [Halohasta salina]